jgi:hypothetical protein
VDPTAPDHPDLLLCYKSKSSARFGTLEAHIDNQFGPDDVTLIHRRELCVPSFNPAATTTTSTTSTTTSTTISCPNTCLNGGTLNADCSCTCPSGYESLNGGCFQIPDPSFPFCGSDCAKGAFGSIDGSGNFLCAKITSSLCPSTSDCPLGSACQLMASPGGRCLAQCKSP